jgi:glycosyltransferase involved in cell wall biosynthesis
MRIVHVTAGYPPRLGGGEVYVERVSEGLARRGHQVTVLTVRESKVTDSSTPLQSAPASSARVLRFSENYTFERFLKRRGAYRLLRTVLREDRIRMLGRGPLSARLFLELLRCKADVVGIFGWWASLLPFEACLVKRFRQWRMVGIPMFHTEEAWSREAVYPPLLNGCDAIITSTGYEQRFVEERLARRAQILISGVGIDPDAFTDRDGRRIRTRYSMGKGPVVGYVGRIVPSKGIPGLVKAMRVVWQWNPDVRLVLAGPRTLVGMRADQEIDLALAGLSDAERARVLLLGEFAERDKASIYDSLDVFAMPSTGESFGIAYLEAWMCGKPVIGANVGSTPSVIRDGVDGLLVDPQDPAHIGQAVVRLLKDPAERARLGQAGYGRTVSEFTWERVIDRFEGLYKQL